VKFFSFLFKKKRREEAKRTAQRISNSSIPFFFIFNKSRFFVFAGASNFKKVCAEHMSQEPEYKRIVVVAVDDSEASKHAFEYTVANVLREGDHLRLIHVQPYREVIGSSHMGAPIYSVGKIRQESKDVARLFAKRCHDLGLTNFKEHIILEDVSIGKAVVEYISELPQKSSDSIQLVLGSRELGFFKKAFVGSVSDYCVNHCHCPVLVVKMPYIKDTEKH
jgi:nucleotide-binding universal stress UspA family protein